MKIYFYMIPNNESFYAVYSIKGLRQNNHDVVIKNPAMPIDEEIEFIKKENFDLIIFLGFGFMNHYCHQQHGRFIPNETGLPFIVCWYDNPFRYFSDLGLLRLTDENRRKFNFMFTVCDSQLADQLKKEHFPTVYLPCCFDPEIQHHRQMAIQYRVDVALAATHQKWDTLMKNRSGLNFQFRQALDKANKLRTPGKYLDYVDYLNRYCQKEDGGFGRLAFCNLMEQKHLLRNDVLDALSEFEVHLFGQGDFEPDRPNLIKHDHLHQHKELPYLYSSAKINLTIELLPASVHQRIFEVAGCGGFILCEDKADMSWCFPNIKEMIWHDLDELKDKARFFLKNESERKKIANEMHAVATAMHTAKIRMGELIDEWMRFK